MSTTTQKITHRPDFATPDEVAAMCTLMARYAGEGQQVEVREWRDGSPEALIADNVVHRIVSLISNEYAPVREEFAMFSVMRQGSLHTPHADAELADGSPNHTPQRSHVGLLYLREPEAGGQLEVWDITQDDPERHVYVPTPGSVVAFPSTREYFHEVNPVEAGERWNLACWVMPR